jgi:hypothetical protein
MLYKQADSLAIAISVLAFVMPATKTQLLLEGLILRL